MTKGEQGKVDIILSMLERHIDSSTIHHEEVTRLVREHAESIAILQTQQVNNEDSIKIVRGHGKALWILILSLCGINVV